jgi:hypothetical protein
MTTQRIAKGLDELPPLHRTHSQLEETLIKISGLMAHCMHGRPNSTGNFRPGWTLKEYEPYGHRGFVTCRNATAGPDRVINVRQTKPNCLPKFCPVYPQ